MGKPVVNDHRIGNEFIAESTEMMPSDVVQSLYSVRGEGIEGDLEVGSDGFVHAIINISYNGKIINLTLKKGARAIRATAMAFETTED